MAGDTHTMQVKLKGGGPWGFRLLGGAGTGLPLTVAKIRRKSKSYKNLQEGDIFLRVNDAPCNNLTYEQVMTIADRSGAELRLEIERRGTVTDEKPTCPVPLKDILPQTTSVKSTIEHIEETKTLVSDKKSLEDSEVVSNTVNVTQEVVSTPQKVIFGDSSKTEMRKEENQTIVNESDSTATLVETPVVKSDLSTKTTSEITPTSERFEKIQTEKLHEKLENSETTIIRTDCQEVIKSHDTNTSAPAMILSSIMPSEELKKDPEDSFQTVKRESYEYTTSEKTEVTKTTKVNGFSSQLDNDLSKNSETPSLQKSSIISSDTLVTSTSVTDVPNKSIDDSFSMWDDHLVSSMAKKKKMFSSSSFYEEPQAIYPTMEEQVEMAKKIAESLADDTNKKSKGANMFFKRAKRSTKWIHEGPEPSSESGATTPDVVPEPFYPEYYVDSNQGGRNGPKLKLVLDPRHPIDAASLRSTGHKISEHNVVSPEVCHGLVRDLESPQGKGSALFAKRKKKSSEWVVDEEKVKSLMKSHETNLSQIKQNTQTTIKENVSPHKLPYDAFTLRNRFDPDRLAETVIQAAECKRRDSIQSNEEQRYETCRSPIVPATPAASYYDIYKAKAPTGWSSPSVTTTPGFGTSSRAIECPEPTSFYPAASSTMSRKFQFQNFNTLPRKWKPSH